MFGGGFLGSGEDNSEHASSNTTTVTTTTETNIRDVGLTGRDAVMMAAVLAGGGEAISEDAAETARAQAAFNYHLQTELAETNAGIMGRQADSLDALGRQSTSQLKLTSGSMNKMVSGFFGLARETQEANERFQEENQETLRQIAGQQGDQYGRLLQITSDTTNPALSLGKDVLLVVGILGAGLIIFGRKK